MAYQDPNATDQYRHPEWAEDSYILFKKYQLRPDIDRAGALSSVTQIKYDQEAALEARLNGEKYQAEINAITPMSPLMALLVTQAVAWHGSEFVVPVTAKDRHDNPHQLAGRMAPLNAYWMGLMIPPHQMLDIELYLNLLYKKMTEEQVTQFRERRARLVRPEDGEPRGEPDPAVGVGHSDRLPAAARYEMEPAGVSSGDTGV